MERRQQSEVLRGSVIDRLTGRNGADTEFGSVSFKNVRQALARDLNWLLNTRVWLPDDVEALEEVRSSILAYGLPDLTVFAWQSETDRADICRIIEDAIKTFEPRLLPHTVHVSLVEDEDEEHSLQHRIRIEGVLHQDPYIEPISFDAEIEKDSGTIAVRGQH